MSSDPANCVLNHLGAALREWFGTGITCPPLGGGSDDVRFIASDSIPLAVWNAHADDCGCGEPFIWVRLVRRYRTERFPVQQAAVVIPCGAAKAIAVELGVGRCAIVKEAPTWDDYGKEMEVSVDDSWRLEGAICRGFACARACGCADSTAVDSVNPIGPAGGVLGWSVAGYVLLG